MSNKINPKQALEMCWYSDGLAADYIKFYNNHIKGQDLSKQGHMAHYLRLLSLINPAEGNQLLDVGTGTAMLSEYCPGFQFTGCDLPKVLMEISTVLYPHNNYRPFDVFTDDAGWIGSYDVVVCNGFIDVMPNALQVLKKLLWATRKYFLLHRQEITKYGNTSEQINGSYNSETYHSIISRTDFYEVIYECGFDIVAEQQLDFNNWENGGSSFLLRKKITAKKL